MTSTDSVLTWGSVDSDTFCHSLQSEAAYSKVVHWKGNSLKYHLETILPAIIRDWNSLPGDIETSPSLDKFTLRLTNYYTYMRFCAYYK